MRWDLVDEEPGVKQPVSCCDDAMLVKAMVVVERAAMRLYIVGG